MAILATDLDMLTVQQLRRLGEHKYSCTTSSFLDARLQAYWDWLVRQLPENLAPNLLTIAGLAINVITSLILFFYSPDARQEIPRWALLLVALGLFVYQSLDAIDGKQARRTKTDGPLGELFDHGCDSISTVFVSIAACVAVKLGTHPGWMFFQCMTALCLFYTAHWQTYVSGTLRFGRFDVTEAQFAVMGLHIVSAIFGQGIWDMTVPYLNVELKCILGVWILLMSFATVYCNMRIILGGGVGKNGSSIAIPIVELPMKLTPVLFAVSVSSILIYSNVTVIFTGGVGKNGSTVAGTSVLSPFIPFSLVVVPSFIIYQKSISHLLETHPCLYLLAFGLVASKVTNRLVVAHMTKSEMKYLDTVLIGPGMLFLNQYFNTAVNEYLVLWLCLIWSFLDLVYFCSSVCLQICSHLQIRLFTIPAPGGKHHHSIPKNGSINRRE